MFNFCAHFSHHFRYFQLKFSHIQPKRNKEIKIRHKNKKKKAGSENKKILTESYFIFSQLQRQRAIVKVRGWH